MAGEPDYKTILLQLIGSLTLCDHMGDVADDVNEALERAGIAIEWNDWSELSAGLAGMGITTLLGTPLSSEDDDGR